MAMQSVQVRLSAEQLAMIDRKVKEGRYPSRSEAIRDYLRKAQLWEVLEKLLELGDIEDQTEEEVKADLDRIREKVYQKMIAPKFRQRKSD
ncbi:MAG: type II toxin-antitoxin system ParD family antitoxin [Candidatus Bipolaricaulia bacterium]